MRWFSRKEEKPSEHAVIVHYSLSDTEYGTTDEREAVFQLEDKLESLIEAHGVGEFDGNEFGGGEAALYCYGPTRTGSSRSSRTRFVASPLGRRT